MTDEVLTWYYYASFQEELLFLLRKLVFYYRELPSQMGHSLFNYLIGYVMFYVRTPQPYGQDAMAGALALLWQVTEPSHDKTNKMACAPSEDSDQPGHRPSLISLRCLLEESLSFAIHWEHNEDWSDWADAQITFC